MYNILMYNILRGIFIGEMYIEQAQFSRTSTIFWTTYLSINIMIMCSFI